MSKYICAWKHRSDEYCVDVYQDKVCHAVDSYVCSVINYATRIQDRTKLIQFFETEAKLKAYDERVKQHVEEEAMSYADEIAEDLGISSSECRRVMQLAIN